MLKFTRDHRWLEINDNEAIFGITSYAQESLDTLTYIKLPELGQAVKANDTVCLVESIRAAIDIICPVSGIIIAVNEVLADTPSLANSSAYDKGWMFRIKLENISEVNDLLDKDAYNALLESL